MSNRNWRLPAGVDELLPPEAWSLELTRRKVLDVFRAWGYEYIDPPMVEYLDALLVGAGADLDLQTLKAVDQKSGRLLGVRADMTSQAVRVDAHSRPMPGVQRLCYAGDVVFANPVSPLDARVPLKAGAELFGAETVSADAEVIALMREVLAAAGIREPIVVLGHMGIYQSLVAPLGLAEAAEAVLFAAVQSKAESDIARLVEGTAVQAALVRLPSLMGERPVLAEARSVLAGHGAGVEKALDALEALADLVLAEVPEIQLRFDLAELVGYGYHNGPVFSAYHADLGRALARGGRYDGIGAAFGRSRPATGFDVLLTELVRALGPAGSEQGAIWVPWPSPAEAQATDDGAKMASRQAAIRSLRAEGEVVVVGLSSGESRPTRCSRVLNYSEGRWTVDGI